MSYLDPCNRFSFTTTSLAMLLHRGMSGSLTAEQVDFRTMIPIGRLIALAKVIPFEDPDASTTTSNSYTVPPILLF